jgi:hypothetical protein
MGRKVKYAGERKIDTNLLFQTLSSMLPYLKDHPEMEDRMLERLYEESVYSTPDLGEVRSWFYEYTSLYLKDHEVYNLLTYVCLFTPCKYHSNEQSMEILKEKCTLIAPTADLDKWARQVCAQQLGKNVAVKLLSFTRTRMSPRGPDPVVFIQRSKPLKMEKGIAHSICSWLIPHSKLHNKVAPYGRRKSSQSHIPYLV